MTQHIRVIGVPFALGGSEPGPAKGPSALIAHGLLKHLEEMGHSASYTDVQKESVTPEIFSSLPEKKGAIRSLRAVREVTRIAGAHTFAAHRRGYFPLILGGDHSVSIGTLPQFLDPAISSSKKVGLLWIDAHYDAHTGRTSHSHYANGLPLASVLGRGTRSLGCYRSEGSSPPKRLRFLPDNVLHVGAGDTDCEPEEKALMQKLCVRTVTMRDIHSLGADTFVRALKKLIKSVDDLIVTFDLDAMHQAVAPGVSFRSKNGMTPSEAFLIADIVRKSGKLRQLEIMEYNPDFEISHEGQPTTLRFVSEFLGRILA